jgi:dephospho-CoA kinase
MRSYGLTGGIGMGKSAAACLLAKSGIPVIDTDDIAREQVEPGRPGFVEVLKEFGSELLDGAGRLDRERLAGIVFRDSEARRRLEGILHPRIRTAWEAWLDSRRSEGRNAAVVVIPLLFETDAEKTFDATICVACTSATQRVRIRARGWSESSLESRMAAQMPVEEKMVRADYVLWTEGGLDLLEAQLQRILPGDGAFTGVSP